MCQALNPELITKMEQRLGKYFPKGEFEVMHTDDEMHLRVSVKDAKFNGKSLMTQHRLVYAALTDLINSGELHSINIKTTTV